MGCPKSDSAPMELDRRMSVSESEAGHSDSDPVGAQLLLLGVYHAEA